MKLAFLIAIQFLFLSALKAQVNLVPNPSFEDTTNCIGIGIYNSSFPWFNPNLASPDYFSLANQCGNSSVNNVFGYQLPRTGNAYVGLYLYLPGIPITREYIEVKLNDTLLANKEYQVKFFLSRANRFGIAVDAIGAYFSDTMILNSSNGSVFSFAPQVVNPFGNVLIDSLNWMEVSGIYTAIGGEQYLTIGNFYDDANTTHIVIDSSPTVFDNGYYYIDDVTIIPVDSLQSINDINLSLKIDIYPNPIQKGTILNLNNRNINIDQSLFSLYDINGRLVAEGNITNSTIEVSDDISTGIYILKLSFGKLHQFIKIIVY